MSPEASPINDAYVPGVCNINTTEIAYRRKAGYLGLALFIILLAVLLALPINRWLRVLLVFPAILAASGFLQAKNHFCVGYAAAGKQNATEGSREAALVSESQQAIDKQRARKINLQSVAIGLIATLLALTVPVLRS